MSIVIDNINIGPGNPPFVIAECCNNFQGSMEIAKQMILAAYAAGVDAVKFQHRRRLTLEQLEELHDFATQRYDTMFLCTAYDKEGVDEIAHLVSAFKIGSAEVTDLDFVKHVASKGRPTFVSTGACGNRDVENAAACFLPAQAILMQCTSIYPTPPHFTRLGAMHTYRQHFGRYSGYSDHTGDVAYPIAAMTLGADVIEVHFTLSKRLPGPDQECSHEPEALGAICRFAHSRAEALRGEKEVFPEELEKISKFRKVAGIGPPRASATAMEDPANPSWAWAKT